jgi:ribosome-associated heat shock protein Hsp15
MNYSSGQRLDKWLLFTRWMKTRSEAATLCESRHLRLDGRVIDRAHTVVRVGQIISFPKGNQSYAVKVSALPQRRGPADEAQSHYQLLAQTPIEAARQSRYDPGRDLSMTQNGGA